MIAADTSSMVAFLEGLEGDDISVIQSALEHHQLALPPAVLTELLSDPALSRSVRTLLGKLERMADAVQVIYLSDDPTVTNWAIEVGFQRAAVVEAVGPFA